MLKIIFLGTGGSIPTPNRGMPSFMLMREGERMLFDCGEGTQRQMMKARSGFMDVASIFLSHFHADHTLGIPGLLQTMSFQGRTEPLYVYGPQFVEEYCRLLNSLGYLNLGFPVIAQRLEPGDRIEFKDYTIEAFRDFHSVPGLGYALREKPRPGRFNKAKALELGVPEGPLFSRLHRGETVVVNGREIKSEDVVGQPRPGRTIVYTGDTVPSQAFLPVPERRGRVDFRVHLRRRHGRQGRGDAALHGRRRRTARGTGRRQATDADTHQLALLPGPGPAAGGR